ncbi:MAG: thioredoxin family protein [Chthoniobacterales bacterium]|nr:thioredoxin family protein [Chthoniobacterales bacterium]
MTDFARAQAQAKAEDKLLLLDFTGSDWCGWCKLMEKEIFSQPTFAEYATKNLVLVRLDFPHAKPLTAEVRTQNQTLAQKLGIRGFPTIVMMNGEGKPLAVLGYVRGGPEVFISELKQVPKS